MGRRVVVVVVAGDGEAIRAGGATGREAGLRGGRSTLSKKDCTYL